MASKEKVRFAVVGTGWFGQAAVLPAFKHVPNAVLAAIVSGDPKKREELGAHYGVKTYAYEEYDSLLASGTIDAVYIALPNSLHRDYTIRAAEAAIAVLCEKPLAANAEDCRRMIDACAARDVPLMTAYRLHFDPANLAAVELVHLGKIGDPRLFSSLNLQQIEENNTRLDPSLDGHPLLDMGIYCINAARYLFREEPYEVSAFAEEGSDSRFQGIPEMVSCVMRFPGHRLATFTCGFGEAKVSEYRIVGTEGDIRLDPAYMHQGKLTMHVTIEGEPETTEYPLKDQVGA
jgi:predicted dehydrogenase